MAGANIKTAVDICVTQHVHGNVALPNTRFAAIDLTNETRIDFPGSGQLLRDHGGNDYARK